MPHLNLNKTVELATSPSFGGDVADWGRTGAGGEPREPSDSDADRRSLSSGMSPRDQGWGAGGAHGGGPRARPFTPDAGLSSLVHHTQKYVESQNLRKCALASLLPSSLRCSLPAVVHCSHTCST